jgi:hypothetical protein
MRRVPEGRHNAQLVGQRSVISDQTEHSGAIIVGYVPSGHYFPNLARLDEVALEDCAAGRYGLHCPPQATAFTLGNCDTLLHKGCTATWCVVVLAVWQVCL